MRQIKTKKILVAALMCGAFVSPAMAQVSVPVTASVQNTVTVTPTQGIDFGVIVAVPDGTNNVNAVMGTDGTLVVTADGAGTSAIAIVDDSAAQPAIVTVTDAADTATLQVTISNVVGPANNGESFAMDTFTYRRNGELSEQSATVGTPFTLTYADNAGAGSTIAIGARIVGAGANDYTETTPYTGSFDVTVAY
ncbi:MAG: hypothetical protein ACRBB3_08965 [Alphaproteobacteria bacterium]